MATLSLHFSPPIRTRTFPTIVACSNGVPLSKPRSNGGPVVMEIPLDKIRRPLMRVRSNNPEKVKELMDSIRVIGLQVPIDVLEVDGVYYGEGKNAIDVLEVDGVYYGEGKNVI